MGALFDRVKSWIDLENLTDEDLNAEFDNILDNLEPLFVDDYSDSVAQMKLQTDPGDLGSESQPTTLAGEIERIRFQLNAIIGGTNSLWYDDPSISLEEANTLLDQTSGLPPNRIVSGRVVSATDSQAAHLVPDGTVRTIKLDASTTDFVYRIEGTAYTISTDQTLTSLIAAPSSNNTALVNDARLADQDLSKLWGEDGARDITIDTVGSEISGLIGEFATFQINDGSSNEYFTAFVKDATTLTQCRRGNFFNSSDSWIPRLAIADNDTITLMKKTYIYARTDLAIEANYNNPTYGPTANRPTSPATDDRHFNTQLEKWERFNGSSWVDADATLIGECFQNTTATVGARSYEAFNFYTSLNNIQIVLDSTTVARMGELGGEVNVKGSTFSYERNTLSWDITNDLIDGETESSSTLYYLYITDLGGPAISEHRGHFRPDLCGYYHPAHNYRMVGSIYNDSSSDLTLASSFDTRAEAFNTEKHLDSGNGAGSTATRVIRFSNVRADIGTHVIQSDSATDGQNFLCTENGKYEAFFTCNYSGGAGQIAITLNPDATAKTTAPSSITYAAGKRAYNQTPAASINGAVTTVVNALIGDEIRMQVSTNTGINTGDVVIGAVRRVE